MQANKAKPFDIVGEFVKRREGGASPRDAWGAVKNEFIQASTASDPEQAWKTASGKAFEKVIRQEFEKQIKDYGLGGEISIQQWEGVKNDLVKRILSDTLWSRCILEEPYEVGSQVDFIESFPDKIVRFAKGASRTRPYTATVHRVCPTPEPVGACPRRAQRV